MQRREKEGGGGGVGGKKCGAEVRSKSEEIKEEVGDGRKEGVG